MAAECSTDGWVELYSHPNTISPISLLELGRYSQSRKLIVCCPEGYHRRGNIQYLCRKDDIQLLEDFDELVKMTIMELEEIVQRKLSVVLGSGA
jgi:hypothetical protein